MSPKKPIAPRTEEEARLDALHRYPLDIEREEPALQDLARIAKLALSVDYSTICFVDRQKVWIEAAEGYEFPPEMPRTESFASMLAITGRSLHIHDASQDPRTAEFPSVQDGPEIRAYCGFPIVTGDGFAIGAICVADSAPRTFTPGDLQMMEGFANLCSNTIELTLKPPPAPIITPEDRQQLGDDDAMQRFREIHRKMFTICAWTNRIRYRETWMEFEEFLKTCLDIRFTHGISEEAYSQLMDEVGDGNGTSGNVKQELGSSPPSKK